MGGTGAPGAMKAIPLPPRRHHVAAAERENLEQGAPRRRCSCSFGIQGPQREEGWMGVVRCVGCRELVPRSHVCSSPLGDRLREIRRRERQAQSAFSALAIIEELASQHGVAGRAFCHVGFQEAMPSPR